MDEEAFQFKVFRVKLSKTHCDKLDRLIEKGVFTSYAEALRRAIDLLLKEYSNPK